MNLKNSNHFKIYTINPYLSSLMSFGLARLKKGISCKNIPTNQHKRMCTKITFLLQVGVQD